MFIGYLKDHLLFSSDWHSLVVTFSFLTIFVLPFGTLLVLALKFLPSRIDKKSIGSNLLFFLLVLLFLIHFISMWTAWVDNYWVYLIGGGFVILASLFIRVPNLKREKVEIISFSFIVLLIGSIFYGYFARPKIAQELLVSNKSIVYIVIDALATDEISRYNPKEAHTPNFDRLVSQGIVFDKMRTSYTYTYGYFAALYRGSADISQSTKESIISKLQKKGVNVSWSTFHSNGIPETSLIYGYDGLKSFFLTQNYVWLPQLLHLPYHVYRYQGHVSSQRIESRGKRLHYLMNHFLNDKESPLSQLLYNGVKGVASLGRPFVYVFHVTKYPFSNKDLGIQGWIKGLSLNESEEEKKERLLANKFHENGGKYESQYEKTVKKWRLQEMNEAEEVIGEVEKGLQRLESLAKSKNIVVVITADHGTLSKDGKLWYGVHNAEEVARVPFLILGAGNSVNDKNYDTMDVPALFEDILHLPRNSISSTGAASMLSGEEKKLTMTMTTGESILLGDKRKKLLNIYLGNTKIVTDVLQKDYIFKAYKLNDYEEITIPFRQENISNLRDSIEQVYGKNIAL